MADPNAPADGRLFGWSHAFDHPVSLGLTLVIAGMLLVAPVAIAWVTRAGRGGESLRSDLVQRYRSWLLLAPMMVLPILAGAAVAIPAIGLLSLLAHREFARATGLFRDRITSATVVLAILLFTFAAFDHWIGLFLAVFPLGTALIAAVNILRDEPKGYLQRVALGVFSLGMFGSGIGHLGMFCNDHDYRPILLWLIFTVQLNDVFAYICGKTFGRRKLAPQTSPKKTVGGALGALVLTSALAGWLATLVFAGTPLSHPVHALTLGVMIALLGQLGDLVMSSVKRDVGIKDMGSAFPGHGGLLDRFDSLLLVAPAVFHYVNHFIGVGSDQPVRLLTGS